MTPEPRRLKQELAEIKHALSVAQRQQQAAKSQLQSQQAETKVATLEKQLRAKTKAYLEQITACSEAG